MQAAAESGAHLRRRRAANLHGVLSGVVSVLSCSIALSFVLCRPKYRASLLARLRQEWPATVIACGLSLLLLAPFVIHSLAGMKTLGRRPYTAVQALLPGIMSWFKQNTANWMYGWLDPYLHIKDNPIFWEESNGLGIVTYGLVILGFWIGRKQPLMRLLAVVSIVLFVVTLRLPGGASLWKFFYLTFPGAGAIRAVGRIGMFLLLPAAIALAVTLRQIRFRSSRLAVLCAVAVAAEQGVSSNMVDKFELRRMVNEVKATLRPDCESFLLTPHRSQWPPVLAHTVGIWTQIATGIPTLNASSGGDPPH